MDNSKEKLNKLTEFISSFESMLVAYSGGVDSTFLAIMAHNVLGSKMLAVTAKSATYPDTEYMEAEKTAKEFGFRHLTIETNELEMNEFTNNSPERCYFCKKELFKKLQQIASDEFMFTVAEGSTLDDESDFRPGKKALKELGILSPLKECGISKSDIRLLSEELNIPTANKPSFACLASRFPYGHEITSEKLKVVANAEDVLRDLGFTQFRVRHHGDIARIEVLPEEIPLLTIHNREHILNTFKKLGFTYITLDLEGYRTGSLNEVISDKEKYL